MDLQHFCQCCTMTYANHEKSCPFCSWPAPNVSNHRNKSHIKCPKCGFQNDLINQLCVACDAHMDQKLESNKVKCQLCGIMIEKVRFQSHSTDCLLSLEFVDQEKKEQSARKQEQNYNATSIQCKYCHLSFPLDLLDQHDQVCLKKPKPVIKPKPAIKPPTFVKPYLPIGKKPYIQPIAPIIDQPYQQIAVPSQLNQNDFFSPQQLARLTKLQKNAIMHMQVKSMKAHAKAQNQLQNRAKKLGFKKQDVQNLLFYIENYAPIIVHIHITRHMQFFVKDTHYRNQFETNKSSGSLSRQSRTQWQNRMFDKTYAKATDHERVKYGVINFTNDPKGVNCAAGYGISYFLLKQHVRNRCTVTDMDSSNINSLIGTFKYCFHILNKINDQQLKSAFNAAKALEQSSTVTTTYKQIQIHGPIQFSKDIQRIYVNKKQVQDKKFLDMVYEFCEKNKIEYEFI